MKKFKTMLAMMLALVGMCVAFTSCGGDDDDDVQIPAAKEIEATYTSNLEMTAMGETSTTEGAVLKIEAENDNTVKVTLPSSGSGMMALPALEVPAVAVSGSNGSYTFEKKDYKGTVTVNGTEKKYTVTLQGTFKNNTLTVNYSLQYGKMPAAMVGKYVANK